MSKDAIAEIMDLFDISSEKDSGEESSDYSATAGEDDSAKPSFDELVDGLGDKIECAAEASSLPVKPTIEKPKEIPKIESPKPADKPVEQKAIVQPVIIAPIVRKNIIDTMKEEEDARCFEAIKKVASDLKPEPDPKINIDSIKSTNLEPVITDDAEESNIDVDDIFGNSSSIVKEEKIEESNVDNVCGDEAKAEGTTEKNDSQQPVEAKVETTPVKTVEQTKAESPKEPIPFDSPADNASKGTQTGTKAAVRKQPKVSLLNKNQINWLLTPSSDKYESFYEAKSDALEYLLPGDREQLNFSQIKAELSGANVDMEVNMEEPNEICFRMDEVQRWKVRVNHIALEVNHQYYCWVRFRDMLRGRLACIEQEKNAERREGVVFLHMRDFELYFSSLELIHYSISGILKNLDSAWETLNRKVTIAHAEKQQKDAVRYQSGVRQQYAPKHIEVEGESVKQDNVRSTSQEPNSMSSFDGMFESETGNTEGSIAQNSQPQTGSKEIDWDDFS